jgi:hypothetical protein
VILRCNAEEARVERCLALSRTLRARGLAPVFAVDGASEAVQALSEAGFRIERRPLGMAEATWLETVWAISGAGSLVLDAESEVAQADIARWRAAGLMILTLDDCTARRLSVDIAVYPGIEARGMDWFGFRGELLYGPEWAFAAGAGAARLSAMIASRTGARVSAQA